MLLEELLVELDDVVALVALLALNPSWAATIVGLIP